MKEFDAERQYRDQRNKYHSANFKVMVVEELQKSGESYKEIAIKYEIPVSSLHKWERIYIDKGTKGFLRPQASSLSVEQKEDLASENYRLRMENAYLKKMNALVQEKEKSQSK